MSDKELKTFPADKIDYLTSLYLENQDLSDLTPAQLLEKYDQIHAEIQKENNKKLKDRKN